MPFCENHQHAYVNVCTECVMDARDKQRADEDRMDSIREEERSRDRNDD